ncbi:hypothetical protein BLAT2472_70335 [Burkholderia latens]
MYVQLSGLNEKAGQSNKRLAGLKKKKPGAVPGFFV